MLALTFVVSLAGSAPASGKTAAAAPSVLTFTDGTGDASGAPDITNVTVSGDANTGALTFAVTVTGYLPTSPGLVRGVAVLLNTDRNDSTGSPSGDEYGLGAWNDATGDWYSVEHWDGAGWQMVPESTTLGCSGTSTITWTANKADLGGATDFSVHSEAIILDASGNLTARDSAPNMGSWDYGIAGPTESMTTFLVPTIGKPTVAPAKTVAGKRLTVSFRVTRTDRGDPTPLTAGTMICDPSVGKKVIPHAESFKNGVARLSFVVPKAAKGKLLKVRVTIKAPSYQGENGVKINISTGHSSLVAQFYSGQSTTKTVSLRIR